MGNSALLDGSYSMSQTNSLLIMYNPYSLENKTVLITGASSGIGRAVAIECSKLGATVIITARNEERLKETFNQLEGKGHRMVLCDLANTDDLQDMADNLDKIQGLILNAGYTQLAPVQYIKEDRLENILKINTIAPVLLMQRLIKRKKIEKGASIVFTSSLAGIGTVTPGNSMYAASKGALSAFIKVAALELASKQIRVNAVCPGMVNTGILENGAVTKEQVAVDIKNYPLGRYGEPRDIALAMIYLLSDASSWVTGTNMIIDGGLTVK